MSWARHVKGGAQSSPSSLLTFPEDNQVPIRCWVDSESFPVFWPERDSNLRPSAPLPSALTTRSRRLSQTLAQNNQRNHVEISCGQCYYVCIIYTLSVEITTLIAASFGDDIYNQITVIIIYGIQQKQQQK